MRQGIMGKVLTTEFIEQHYRGVDRAEKIRNAIKYFHANEGVVYVLLAGDNEDIPLRMVFVSLNQGADDSIPTDLYYSDLDGTWDKNNNGVFGEVADSVDLYPDVYVSRIPVKTKAEFFYYIKKLKAYKETVSWSTLSNVLFHSSSITQKTDGSAYVNTIADEFPEYFQKAFLYQDQAPITLSEFLHYLKGGVSYVYTLAHGDMSEIFLNYMNVPFSIASIPRADSTNATFFDIASCHTGAVDKDCLLEYIFKSPIAIAARSCTRNDFTSSTQMSEKLYHLIFNTERPVGWADGQSRADMVPISAQDNQFRYSLYSYILLSDPLLSLWRGTPLNFTSNIPDTIQDSILAMRITDEYGNPVESARVVLYKPFEFMEYEYTNALGKVLLKIPSNSPGYAYLTFVHPKFHIRDKKIWVNYSYFPARLDSLSVSDSVEGGNHNGVIEAREPFSMIMKITPQDTVSNLTVQLVQIPGALHFSDTSFSFSDMSSAQLCVFNGISDFFQGDSSFKIKIELNTSFKSYLDSMDISISGPVIGINSLSYRLDGDTLFSNFTIGNSGNGEARNLTCKIIPEVDGVHVISDTSFISNIPPLSIASPVFPILITTDTLIPLKFTVHSQNLNDTFRCKLHIVGRPWGLSAVPYPGRIKLQWTKVQGLRYNVYRWTDDRKTKVLLTPYPVNAAFFEDNGLSYKQYYYDISAVDSTGMESMHSDSVGAVPNPEYKEGWPVSVFGTGYSSPLVADVNALYPGKEIIIGTFQDSLLYCFAQDGTLIPGWPVDLHGVIFSSPAAYDFDSDGINEIVIAPWHGNNQLFVLDGSGKTLPGWPRDMEWGSFSTPAIGDLNNDGVPEIVAKSSHGWMYIFEPSGYCPDSFKLEGGFSSPSIGDIDEDGIPDIVVGSKDTANTLYVFDFVNDSLEIKQGFPVGAGGCQSSIVIGDVRSDYPGKEIFLCTDNQRAALYTSIGDTIWTRPVSNTPYFFNPSAGDIDGDGTIELAVNMGTGVAVFEPDGTYFNGYPTGLAAGGPSTCLISDLNNDGYREIIKGSVDSKLYALTYGTNQMEGFPIDLLSYAYPSPAVDDLNQNGDANLIASSFANELFVFNFAVPFDTSSYSWPMLKHDIHRTGNLDYRYGDVKDKNMHMGKLRLLSNTVSRSLKIYSTYNCAFLNVFDAQGRRVAVFQLKAGKNIFDIASFKSGIYFLKSKQFKSKIVVLK